MDPYGRFYLADCRGGFPVDVELNDGYRVLEDAAGRKVLLSPRGLLTSMTDALRQGAARIV